MDQNQPLASATLHPLQAAGVRGARLLVGCESLEPTLSYLLQTLGFRLDAIFPADSPVVALLSGHGLALRLEQGAANGTGDIELLCETPLAVGQTEYIAPNGLRVHLTAAETPLQRPIARQSLVVSRGGSADAWGIGRAGMRYRDLLPDRHGGAFIASHIRILEGGPLPDYVHYHEIRFQTIFCRKGWVRVVYEGQGEPFVMNAGDCVLQPPEIRHRVLESSAGAEVVEVGTPAEHVTRVDHAMQLPTAERYPERDFGGQRFVRHIAADALWQPWRMQGFEMRDTGIGKATGGLAGVRVLRPSGASGTAPQQHATELCFYFVLAGRLTVHVDGQALSLQSDDSIAIADTMVYRFSDASSDLSLLEITLPDAVAMR